MSRSPLLPSAEKSRGGRLPPGTVFFACITVTGKNFSSSLGRWTVAAGGAAAWHSPPTRNLWRACGGARAHPGRGGGSAIARTDPCWRGLPRPLPGPRGRPQCPPRVPLGPGRPFAPPAATLLGPARAAERGTDPLSRFPDEHIHDVLGLVRVDPRTRNFPWAIA
jgi:hypothetical protein